jgi:hypothetical protein
VNPSFPQQVFGFLYPKTAQHSPSPESHSPAAHAGFSDRLPTSDEFQRSVAAFVWIGLIDAMAWRPA